MTYEEVYRDLFTVGENYVLAHCISADAKMGAGIAVEFKERFDLTQLQQMAKINSLKVGCCVLIGRTFNLVTKEVYWRKPTYETFTMALEDMKNLSIEHGIKKIAMPQIGAGLDRLKWSRNKEIIQEVFNDTDVEILVCNLK
ncbi:macro domain-containing protein [Thermoactinomyces sp. DSM 45892]|uniref:macro domain-containing protein n=1 Tax=Thermoactinomyces sp. DSM 45892 TaxID=1882753 RepID=UPI00089899D3|nr:macro domain-containing protein [Thermoactinomyces sp. DSM 45892]SDZ32000.1 O-acetyl-ADP-ribose deacetylase (regulator of RNase III), contains Macro domain [Thermoactinomyces sp. DSM 45892]